MGPAPRPQPKYSQDIHGRSLRETGGGFHITKPGSDILVKCPSWQKTLTVFRPYPSLRYDEPTEFEPYRIDPGGRNLFSNWLRRYDCWWKVGSPRTTILINNPEEDKGMFDPLATPLAVLYRAVVDALKKEKALPEWQPLRQKSDQGGPPLVMPGELWAMQGTVPCFKSEKTYSERTAPWGYGPNPPIMMVLSSGLGRDLQHYLNLEHENYQGLPGDFNKRYVYGDPVAIDSGRFFYFFERGTPLNIVGKKDDKPDMFAGNKKSWSSQPPPSSQKQLMGFDLLIDAQYDSVPAKIPADSVGMVKSKWRYWEDCLHFYTPEEQAHKCFAVFPKSACIYAFEGVNRDWIPEGERKAYVRAVSANVPVQPPTSNYPSHPDADQGDTPWSGWQKADKSAVPTETDITVPQGTIDDDDSVFAE